METPGCQFRPIAPHDNAMVASIIRNALAEHGANKPGTVYYDAETDALYELFERTPHAAYYVVESDGEVVGAGGYFPTPQLPEGTCELVKMYLAPAARNKGLGRKLLQFIMEQAKLAGYRNMYLESMPELKNAIALYEKNGFTHIESAIGASGHFGCDIHMMRRL